jgi:hypothetical protein
LSSDNLAFIAENDSEEKYQDEVAAVTNGKVTSELKQQRRRYANPQQALFERGRQRQEQKVIVVLIFKPTLFCWLFFQQFEFNKIKEEQTNLELQACTFHPNINHSVNKRPSTPVVERY